MTVCIQWKNLKKRFYRNNDDQEIEQTEPGFKKKPEQQKEKNDYKKKEGSNIDNPQKPEITMINHASITP